jgi:DNA-binding CsgD family transcriptional regulator
VSTVITPHERPADDPQGRANPAVPSAVTPPAEMSPPEWDELLAVGLVAEDLSPSGIARYAGVPLAAAHAALERAHREGVTTTDGRVEPRTATELVGRLPASQVAAIHADVARRVLGGTPEDLRRGLHHLREAAAAMVSSELVALADRAGRFALEVADPEAARDLLLLALEHELGDDLRLEAERNLLLSRALTLLGDPAGAQARLMRTVLVAEGCGATGIAVRAAERFALPADWQAGDSRVVGMIARVQRMPDLTEDDRVRLLAIRAWAEARLPVARAEHQQVSWIGRPHVARPLAVEALHASADATPSTRLLALLAWRHTHRAPQFLAERREVSSEALTLAETIGAAAEQVEAATLLAVDALEAGDRSTHRAALTTAAAVAERSGDPRLRWRALVPAAGSALMELDVPRAQALAREAFVAGESSAAPGLLASQWTFTGHLATRHDDAPSIVESLATDASVLATSPLGRSGLALLLARADRREEAAAHAWATLHQLDEESSLLLTLSRLADAAIALGDVGLARELLPLLAPWSGRVVVDANGWWCDGPVDLWLAELTMLAGDGPEEQVLQLLDAAAAMARRTGDLRSSDRIGQAITRASERTASDCEGTLELDPVAALGLSARETIVLRLLATGASYQQMAKRIGYSVSTVRNDVVSIYRKLGARSRSEAVAKAFRLGFDLEGATNDGATNVRAAKA